ncbi:NmrA/HSCARG family protein [Sphingobium yanoikuyae]|nr:NmrA/HSCARG family protein [Sphingobium yanoikuyae]
MMTILVTGATGTQGMAVAQALLADGQMVRALVRDIDAPAARLLIEAGATLAQGSFEQPASLRAAMEGIDALFSVQLAPDRQHDRERDQARALVDAAIRAGVRHVVHSSVSNSGDFRAMSGWSEGRWERNYWESKADVEDMVRTAGFPVHTVLRPAFMMDNFAMPKAGWMFPDLAGGKILTAVSPETPIVLVAAEDIGQTAAAAIRQPMRFAGAVIELAGELLTLPSIAAILTAISGATVAALTCNADSLIARGQHHGWVQTQQWMNVVNYPARPAMMMHWGLAPTRFADWAARHAYALPCARQR